jgi:hypothetical protein
MRFRSLTPATVVLAATAVVLLTGHCWAHWYNLGPSKDEWGLKYEGEVEPGNGDKLNVRFTISGQGRLKPIHSVFVMAFSNPDRTGTQLVKTHINMKPAENGKLTGQVEVSKEFANRAVIRVFTETVDGKSQMAGKMAGARYYDIPLTKFMKTPPLADSSPSRSSTAAPSKSKVTK